MCISFNEMIVKNFQLPHFFGELKCFTRPAVMPIQIKITIFNHWSWKISATKYWTVINQSWELWLRATWKEHFFESSYAGQNWFRKHEDNLIIVMVELPNKIFYSFWLQTLYSKLVSTYCAACMYLLSCIRKPRHYLWITAYNN